MPHPISSTASRAKAALHPRCGRSRFPARPPHAEQRFLGSPTVRVNGSDVEPGGEDRTDYGLSCRVYVGENGVSGCPDAGWLREALASG
jgi:hypothetical protein